MGPPSSPTGPRPPGLGRWGWTLHLFGLCATQRRLPSVQVVFWNIVAVLLTVAAIWAALVWSPVGWRWLLAIAAWAVGHLGWGLVLRRLHASGRVFGRAPM